MNMPSPHNQYMEEAEFKPELAWMQSLVLNHDASLPLIRYLVTLADFVATLSSSIHSGLPNTKPCAPQGRQCFQMIKGTQVGDRWLGSEIGLCQLGDPVQISSLSSSIDWE